MGFCELPAKVKYQFSYSYFVLLTSVRHVSDDFQTFWTINLTYLICWIQLLFQNLQTFRVSDTNQAYNSSPGENFFANMRKSQQDLFTKLKRTPINFLSLFHYNSNKIKNLIKNVNLKEKVLLCITRISLNIKSKMSNFKPIQPVVQLNALWSSESQSKWSNSNVKMIYKCFLDESNRINKF